jgi:hypothetical protein
MARFDPNVWFSAKYQPKVRSLAKRASGDVQRVTTKRAAGTAASGSRRTLITPGPPALGPGLGPVEGVAFGSDVSAAGAMGAGPASKEGFFEMLKNPQSRAKLMKSKAVQTLGVAVLADMLIKSALGGISDAQQADAQGAQMDLQAQYGPQIQQQQALQPVTEARKQQALMMLMRQMGQPMPNTADGEVWT